MEIDKLIERLGYPLHKVDVVEYARVFAEIPQGDELMFNLLVGDEEAIRPHAAWVFEQLLEGNGELQLKWFYPIVEAMPRENNQSVRRFFAKLVKCTLQNSMLHAGVDEVNHVQEFIQLAEICFDWLLDERAIVSVQSLCIEVLVVLAGTNSWVKSELPMVVRNLPTAQMPAIRCKLAKVASLV